MLLQTTFFSIAIFLQVHLSARRIGIFDNFHIFQKYFSIILLIFLLSHSRVTDVFI